MAGPLSGYRVFDLTLAGVGPWAGKLLGALGADVIHVFAPDVQLPDVPPTINGYGMLKMIANYNKRGITLDLKSPKDKAIALKLLERSDVFLENMRAGVVGRLGLDYDTISKINPRIVYCSSSGWGQGGPMSHLPAGDSVIQTFGGWTSVTGQPGKAGEFFRHWAHLDYNTSVYIVEGILQGLLHRERTGRGQKIELTMLGAAMSLQTSRLAEFFATGKTPSRMGSGNTTTVPHQAFLCQDGRWLMLGVVQEEQWPRLCRAIGKEELIADPRFATNPLRVQQRDALIPILEDVFSTKPVRWWEIRLSEAMVPHGRALSFDSLRWHPQVTENQHMVQMETPRWGTFYTEGLPWRFSETPGRTFRAPWLGEHTREIVEELGMAGEPAVQAKQRP